MRVNSDGSRGAGPSRNSWGADETDATDLTDRSSVDLPSSWLVERTRGGVNYPILGSSPFILAVLLAGRRGESRRSDPSHPLDPSHPITAVP